MALAVDASKSLVQRPPKESDRVYPLGISLNYFTNREQMAVHCHVRKMGFAGYSHMKMLDTLAPGDVVTVTRIDRLARSTFDLFAIVKQIVDAKAQFRSLAEPWADTGTSTGRLRIAMLGGLAGVERDLIRTRTAEGRSRAQKRGQRMGRKPKLTEGQQAEARRRRAEGATLAELARSYGVGKSTISRL